MENPIPNSPMPACPKDDAGMSKHRLSPYNAYYHNWLTLNFTASDSSSDDKGKGQFLGENVAAHCKVMWHSTVSSAKSSWTDRFGWRLGWAQETMYWIGVHIPQWQWAIFGGCPDHSKALAICCRISCKMDNSIANNAMQQKGSFSMPGKRKYESGKFWAPAMQRIGPEGDDGSAQRGRSLISAIALLWICE